MWNIPRGERELDGRVVWRCTPCKCCQYNSPIQYDQISRVYPHVNSSRGMSGFLFSMIDALKFGPPEASGARPADSHRHGVRPTPRIPPHIFIILVYYHCTVRVYDCVPNVFPPKSQGIDLIDHTVRGRGIPRVSCCEISITYPDLGRC